MLIVSTRSVDAASACDVEEFVGAEDEVKLSEVWGESLGAKCMLIIAGSSVEVVERVTVMGMAGLWYFSLTSSCRQNFLSTPSALRPELWRYDGLCVPTAVPYVHHQSSG